MILIVLMILLPGGVVPMIKIKIKITSRRGREREIFTMRACMSAAVIEYALCGCRCALRNEDRVGR